MTNQSISFVPGTPASSASFSGLHEASGFGNGVDPTSRPGLDHPAQLYDWLVASFAWGPVDLGNAPLNRQFRTGKTAPNGDNPLSCR